MPVYEYECLSCIKVHEVLQKFSDLPLEECPDCGSKVKKLMSLNSFSLKGGGWYATDYKKTPQPTPKPKVESTPPPTPSKPASTESKASTPATPAKTSP